MNVKEMKGRFMQLYSILVNSAVLLTSLFLINTMSRERERKREKEREKERGDKCPFALFGGIQ